ncbi:hypothetical protein [Portibacter marinus]|uniref:hypothetical protein n=1 Tax=Portibacter marinus TaxID=2898660 RepID=UPI001F30F977|nr:hypothetical protein [Portibacter marinus]
MKSNIPFLLSVVLTTISCSFGLSQTPPPCNLCSQADVDNYSGVFLSSISISGEDITNLDGMSSATVGSGSAYYIYNNPRLKSIEGLSSVISNSLGTWYFINNDSLKSIDLPVGSTGLEIRDNDMLDSVRIIDFSIELNVKISNNLYLKSMVLGEGPSNVVKSIEVSSNSSLRNLDGLSTLIDVTENISILNNPSLAEFCGLRPLLITEPTLPLNISGNLFNPSNTYIITDGECGNFITNGSGFATLQEALAAATDYSFIKVTRDVTISDATAFPGGQNLTLVVEPLRTLTLDAPFTNEGIIINHGTIRMLNGNIFTNIGPSVMTGNLILEE